MQFHGVEVVIMPGVGHFLMMEDPERFNVLLKGTIKKIADQKPEKLMPCVPFYWP